MWIYIYDYNARSRIRVCILRKLAYAKNKCKKVASARYMPRAGIILWYKKNDDDRTYIDCRICSVKRHHAINNMIFIVIGIKSIM